MKECCPFKCDIRLYYSSVQKTRQHSWDRTAGKATRTGLMDQRVNSDNSKSFYSSPKHPDQLWGLPSLIYNGLYTNFKKSTLFSFIKEGGYFQQKLARKF
jgi:hypothetical protein